MISKNDFKKNGKYKVVLKDGTVLSTCEANEIKDDKVLLLNNSLGASKWFSYNDIKECKKVFF